MTKPWLWLTLMALEGLGTLGILWIGAFTARRVGIGAVRIGVAMVIAVAIAVGVIYMWMGGVDG